MFFQAKITPVIGLGWNGRVERHSIVKGSTFRENIGPQLCASCSNLQICHQDKPASDASEKDFPYGGNKRIMAFSIMNGRLNPFETAFWCRQKPSHCKNRYDSWDDNQFCKKLSHYLSA